MISIINRPGATECHVAEESIEKNRSKAHGPKTTIQQTIEVSKEITYDVRRRGLSDSWSLVRFLYSKAVYEPEKLSLLDRYILDSVLERLLSVRDYSWNAKYRKTLLRVSNNFKLLENASEGFKSASKGLKILINTFEWGFLLSSHAYYGRKDPHYYRRWIIRRNRQLKLSPPPQRYIGVGYRDHGTCSIPSFDASPAWQTVASALVSESDFQTHPASNSCYSVIFSHFERKLVPISCPW